MYQDQSWNVVTGAELDAFLAQVGTIDDKHPTSTQSTKVAWRQLPFYDQIALIKMEDAGWDPQGMCVYYLANQGKLTRLDGTSPPIHETNAEAPIKVSEENVLEYLRFFCFFVRGEEGPFLITEDMGNPYIPADLDDKSRKVVEGAVRPASFEGQDEHGNFLCDATVFYSNALFLANFSVQTGGMIEMLDDEPLATDLNARVKAPIA